jgi:hypothetical protein
MIGASSRQVESDDSAGDRTDRSADDDAAALERRGLLSDEGTSPRVGVMTPVGTR